MVSIVFSWQKERESVGTDQAAPAFIPMFRECGPRYAGGSREALPVPLPRKDSIARADCQTRCVPVRPVHKKEK